MSYVMQPPAAGVATPQLEQLRLPPNIGDSAISLKKHSRYKMTGDDLGCPILYPKVKQYIRKKN
jgi:hypothetical protein